MRVHPLSAATLLTAAAVSASGCNVGDARANTSTVRDSAGVQIVESSDARWRADEVLVVSPEPIVAIGEEDGEPEYQFGRVGDAKRLSDGRIVVLDAMANELRYFDAQGRFLTKTGGKGSGPGEYQFPSWLRKLPGDSLLVNDHMAQRLTVVTGDGTLGRTINLAAQQTSSPEPTAAEGGRARMVLSGLGRYQVVAPFADGSLLARANQNTAPNEGIVTRDSLMLVRLAPDGMLRDTVGTFVGDERTMSRAGSNNNFSMMIGPPPFGKSTQLAVDADGFYLGGADAFEIGRYDGEGRLQRIIRRPVQPLTVTPEDVEARKKREIEGSSGGGMNEAQIRRMVEAKWENATIPKTMAAHGEIRVDAVGRLWVRETTPSAEERPHYSLFDAEGRYLGTVVLPVRFRVVDLGEDWVLGIARDEMDLEQVRLYRLQPTRS